MILLQASSYGGSNPTIIGLIVVFVVIEFIYSLYYGGRAGRRFSKETRRIREVKSILDKAVENKDQPFPVTKHLHPAVDYLVNCRQEEHPVDSEQFSSILYSTTESISHSINSAINLLPVLGLMGTFLGIIIGITGIKLNPDVDSTSIRDSIGPLISSAGLAFVSSFVALLCALVLKLMYNWQRSKIDELLVSTEQALMIKYLPTQMQGTTENKFTKVVSRLDRTVNSFTHNIESIFSQFIEKFGDLLKELHGLSKKSIETMENIAKKLNESTADTLKEVEQKFSTTVVKLETSITGFVERIDNSYKHFLEEFRPLIDLYKLVSDAVLGSLRELSGEFKETIAATLKLIEGVSEALKENTAALSEIVRSQSEQTAVLTEVVPKFKDAIDSLQKSMELAKQNLDEFVKLGTEMKNSISEMHSPLKEIIDNQLKLMETNKEIVSQIATLFQNINQLPSYIESVQKYLGALNDKLDKFSEVGDKVHDVKAKFDEFSQHLDQLLQQFVADADKFRILMQNSFADYDKALRTLFAGLNQDSKRFNLFYIKPESIQMLQEIFEDNKQMLEGMKDYSESLKINLSNLENALDSFRLWGFYTRKKDKEDKK